MAHEQSTTDEQTHEVDAVESVIHSIPFVIPAYGAVLIFVLAMIAVTVG